MHLLIRVFFTAAVVFLSAGCLLAEDAPKFKEIDLDRFIEAGTLGSEGKKIIKIAEPVVFSAKMKRYPDKKEMSYVYTALQIAGVDPVPEVNHRMFVESREGRIIPVYVEKEAVAKINGGLREEQEAYFFGYHLYNYEKGPAIMVVDYAPAGENGSGGLKGFLQKWLWPE